MCVYFVQLDIVNTAPQAEQKKKTRKKKGVVGGDGETERVGKDRVHVVNLCSDDDGDFQPIAINTNFSAQKAFDLSGNEEMSVNLKFHTEFSRVNARPVSENAGYGDCHIKAFPRLFLVSKNFGSDGEFRSEKADRPEHDPPAVQG